MKIFCILILFMSVSILPQQIKIPEYYDFNKEFSDSLNKIIKDVSLDGVYSIGSRGTEQISFAVIDLNGDKPVFGGVNYDNFIYPASVYKMYVAMEILKQVSEGNYSLFTEYVVKSPNDLDKIKEISYDPRPLLRDGDTVNINYLLDLMITRSDNSAAYCLMDVAGFDNITETIHKNGWYGSEVTKRYLSVIYDNPTYDTIRSTVTCALHAADFMYKVYTNQLVNPWVSKQMKTFLGRQMDTTKLSLGLPDNAMFYHKTGWWSYWTNDVGIVDDGKIKYIIALFTPVTEEKVRPKLKTISRRVYNLITERHK